MDRGGEGGESEREEQSRTTKTTTAPSTPLSGWKFQARDARYKEKFCSNTGSKSQRVVEYSYLGLFESSSYTARYTLTGVLVTQFSTCSSPV